MTLAFCLGPALALASGTCLWYYPTITTIVVGLVSLQIGRGVVSKGKAKPLKCVVEPAGPDKPLLFMMHGWPDNEHVWSAQVARFRDSHRVVRAVLPNFGGALVETWGYGFDELVGAAIQALEQQLEQAGRAKATLLVHDWGSIIGMQLQRRRPDLVERMVVLDVAWSGKPHPLPKLVAMGLAYQWWAALCWLVAVCVPVIGERVGTAMSRFQLARMGRLPPTSLSQRPTELTALMNFPYFYYQLEGVLELLGLRRPFDQRHSSEATPWCFEDAGAPILFIYGADKSFPFHSPSFERKVRAREGCDAIGLNRGDDGCSTTEVGHWVQVTCAERVNREIAAWLGC